MNPRLPAALRTSVLIAAAMLAAATHAQAPAIPVAPMPTAPDYTAPAVAAAPSGGPVKNADYVIDPTHTFVNYEMGHYGTTTNRGRFSTKDGSVKIDATGLGGRVDIVMDISSINTGVDLLNRHVQSKDFFNVADFPTARFTAERIVFAGDKVSEVPGTLTLMGKALPISLKANRFNCYLNPLINRQVCGGDFETTILRSQWGLTWGINFGFEDRVRLLVQVEAINLAPPTP
ncbi:MAG: YceI family protein [Pseudomonadota bacterium]